MTTTIRRMNDADHRVVYELVRRALLLDHFSFDLFCEKVSPHAGFDLDEHRSYVAEIDGHTAGMMHTVIRATAAKAWLGIFAVDGRWRRKGIALQLFRKVLQDWQACNCAEAEVLAIPGNYLTPGLDPRYTEALAFIEGVGFQRIRDCVNLTCDLTSPFETAPDERRMSAQGIQVRRANREDQPMLDAFFDEQFGDDWRTEAALAMGNDPPAIHIALLGNRIIAFSAHSAQNREW